MEWSLSETNSDFFRSFFRDLEGALLRPRPTPSRIIETRYLIVLRKSSSRFEREEVVEELPFQAETKPRLES
jgi:hypothetical protein